MILPPSGHEPVMLQEVLEALSLRAGATVVDCTVGRGGHAMEIARRLGGGGLLIGLDADPRNLAFAGERLKGVECQVRLFHANFAELGIVLGEVGRSSVDGILADLGISTNQLFDAGYGLSFERSMPLDMRLDPRLPENAADLVNKLPQEQLANVLYELAQERWSRQIARKIVETRRRSPIRDTETLAELVRSAIPLRRAKPSGRRGEPAGRIDPATRTFLALRMAVNEEMSNLRALLRQGPAALGPGGRMAAISFQSMEDRSVKQAFRSLEQTGVVRTITKKPLSPSPEEIARNPRARSAKLRVIEKK
ncbi:MAG TPA: 16S rRNA (cytosine(1402)-N(4))-methyltransferase RsmH [Tepidisphaeraceae bacterium]|nr:16S rRNA (cytosine(1402)-N(4))-methyltransferase RsmH [Tepidisphaeraceae bacterium]